ISSPSMHGWLRPTEPLTIRSEVIGDFQEPYGAISIAFATLSPFLSPPDRARISTWAGHVRCKNVPDRSKLFNSKVLSQGPRLGRRAAHCAAGNGLRPGRYRASAKLLSQPRKGFTRLMQP